MGRSSSPQKTKIKEKRIAVRSKSKTIYPCSSNSSAKIDGFDGIPLYRKAQQSLLKSSTNLRRSFSKLSFESRRKMRKALESQHKIDVTRFPSPFRDKPPSLLQASFGNLSGRRIFADLTKVTLKGSQTSACI